MFQPLKALTCSLSLQNLFQPDGAYGLSCRILDIWKFVNRHKHV